MTTNKLGTKVKELLASFMSTSLDWELAGYSQKKVVLGLMPAPPKFTIYINNFAHRITTAICECSGNTKLEDRVGSCVNL